LITNKDILFTVGNTTKNLKEGEIWEINNQNLHSVQNNSKEERIHLIIDYLP
jgi:quercetin dioxygenase-like cupin family protein